MRILIKPQDKLDWKFVNTTSVDASITYIVTTESTFITDGRQIDGDRAVPPSLAERLYPKLPKDEGIVYSPIVRLNFLNFELYVSLLTAQIIITKLFKKEIESIIFDFHKGVVIINDGEPWPMVVEGGEDYKELKELTDKTIESLKEKRGYDAFCAYLKIAERYAKVSEDLNNNPNNLPRYSVELSLLKNRHRQMLEAMKKYEALFSCFMEQEASIEELKEQIVQEANNAVRWQIKPDDKISEREIVAMVSKRIKEDCRRIGLKKAIETAKLLEGKEVYTLTTEVLENLDNTTRDVIIARRNGDSRESITDLMIEDQKTFAQSYMANNQEFHMFDPENIEAELEHIERLLAQFWDGNPLCIAKQNDDEDADNNRRCFEFE